MKALYGSKNTFKNVTEIVQKFINGKKIIIPKDSKLNNYFGDPTPNTVKQLIIYINNKEFKINEYDTNKDVVIDLDKEIMSKTSSNNKKDYKEMSKLIPKYIDEIKNIHKGSDIYVICSGKSLDFIDESFFKDKITVGVNQVYKKLKTNYLVRKENRFMVDTLKRNPKTVHCITKGDCGSINSKNLHTFINNHDLHHLKVYFANHDQNNHEVRFPIDPNKLVVSHSTSSTAVHLGAYLGASNIILVGNDGGSINGETNFSGYYENGIQGQGSKENYNKWLKSIKNDLFVLKVWLKEKYNCNLYSLNPFTSLNLDGYTFK